MLGSTRDKLSMMHSDNKPANKNRVFNRNTPLNPLLIEGKAEDLQIRGGTGIGNDVQAGKQP